MNSPMVALFGSIIAVVLLLLLSISIFYMASDVVSYCATVIPCTAPSPKRFSDGLIYVVATVSGLVSALVIAQLSVAEPGSAPAVGTFAA